MNLRSGIEAKDYDSVREKENLQPLELELRRMEELAEEYVEALLSLYLLRCDPCRYHQHSWNVGTISRSRIVLVHWPAALVVARRTL